MTWSTFFVGAAEGARGLTKPQIAALGAAEVVEQESGPFRVLGDLRPRVFSLARASFVVDWWIAGLFSARRTIIDPELSKKRQSTFVSLRPDGSS